MELTKHNVRSIGVNSCRPAVNIVKFTHHHLPLAPCGSGLFYVHTQYIRKVAREGNEVMQMQFHVVK